MGLSEEQKKEVLDLIWAARDGLLTDDGVARLERLVHEEPEARRIYVQSADMIAELLWTSATDRQAIADDVLACPVAETDQPRVGKDPLSTRRARPRGFGRIAQALRPTKHPFAFASVSAALTAVWCFTLFVAMWWLLRPQDAPPLVAERSSGDVVAHVTGRHDAVWVQDAEAKTADRRRTELYAGDRVALRKGLVEITFNDGAKVVLEGPVDFEVESAAVGRLQRGRAVATVPSGAIGFAIDTPNMAVTDLGTRFAVEVEKEIASVHVLEGRVGVALLDDAGNVYRTDTLTTGKSLRWDAAQKSATEAGKAKQFVSRLPNREALSLDSTGRNIGLGRPDVRWKIVKAKGDSAFRAGPAVVAALDPSWAKNVPNESQWISLRRDVRSIPGNAVYTFQTTFDLAGFDPATAEMSIRYLVDNDLHAIRLNGRAIPFRSKRVMEFQKIQALHVNEGFVQGVNTLEFDVWNAGRTATPLGLRVELAGHATRKTKQKGDLTGGT